MSNNTIITELTTVFLINTTDINNNTTDCVENFTQNFYDELWRSKSWFAHNRNILINAHWFSYPPPPKEALEFLAALYVLIMSAGIFGNSLVIFMFIRCKSLHSPANILVTNLAVSDLTMMLKMPLFIHHSLNQGLPLGDIACKIYGFVGGLSGTVSICTLSCIALDRYYVVVYPLNRSVTTLRSKICIAVSWIYGLIFASLPLFNTTFGTYVPEGYLTSCSFDYLTQDDSIRYFILGYFFAAWVLPFLIICFCYSKIIRVVILARNIGSKMEDPSNSSRHCKEQEQKKKEIRLALVVLGIIGLWFAAWTPYAVVALLGIAGQKDLITPLSSMIPALFCKSASCIDPFVYAVTNQKFKEELNSFLCKRCTRKKPEEKKVWSTQMSRQPTVKCSTNNSEDGVEEIIVSMKPLELCAVPLQMEKEIKKSTPKKLLGGSSVQPSESTEAETSISDVGKKHRASWVFRPTFSNRSSSIRNMARSWNRSKEKSIEETGSL